MNTHNLNTKLNPDSFSPEEWHAMECMPQYPLSNGEGPKNSGLERLALLRTMQHLLGGSLVLETISTLEWGMFARFHRDLAETILASLVEGMNLALLECNQKVALFINPSNPQ